MERLKGKVAVVTGGGNGIGAAVCRRLHVEGARVLVADIDMTAAQNVSDALATSMAWQASVAPTIPGQGVPPHRSACFCRLTSPTKRKLSPW